VQDSSGFGNAGTLNVGASGTQTNIGTAASVDTASAWYNGRSGKYSGSLNFDGSDDYITAGTSPTFDFSNTQSFSVSAWINSQDWHSGDQANPVVQKYNWGPHDGWLLGIRSGNCFGLNLYSRTLMPADQGRSACVTANTAISLNNWHHVVGITDKTSNYIHFYLDGKLAASTSITSWTSASTTGLNLMIGHYGSAISGWGYAAFQGQIDEVKIFNYALTATQIKTLYNNGAVSFGN
jgi:hypothetical protein